MVGTDADADVWRSEIRQVGHGESVVVLGPSGSGKTTLLNLIGALDTPTEGRIVIQGEDITRASRRDLFRFRRHAVGLIFQSFNLFPALRALENVAFGADVTGRDDSKERAGDARPGRLDGTRRPSSA